MQEDTADLASAFKNKDENKSKEELIQSLDRLRAYSQRLKNIVDRYEKTSSGGEDSGVREDFTGQIESLKKELQSKQEELEVQKEELEVQNEELTTQMDELRESHDALLRSEEVRSCLASIVESSEDAIIGKTISGIVTSWNRGAENIYGYPAREMIGQHISILAPPDLTDEMPGLLAKVKIGAHIDHYETIRVRKDGKKIVVSLSVSPIMDRSGQIVGASTIARDITERKQNEEKLKKSRAILSRAQDLAHVGNWAWELKTNDMIWSDEIFRIFGMRPQAIKPSYSWLLSRVHPEDVKIVEESAESAIKDNKLFNFDFRIITEDGSTRYVNVIADRIKKDANGDPEWMYGIAQDISERKRVEETLQLTQFAVDNFTDSSIWLDGNGNVIYANAMTSQSLGYTKDELLAMRIWDIDPSYPKKEFFRIWREIKRNGATKLESTHVRKDGSSFPVEVSANHMRFKDQEIMVTFDRDITGRKEAEEELIDAKAQAELYLDLMGHDINNLNQIALGYLELANDTFTDAASLELISKPLDAINSSSRLIENVRKLQKIRSGNLKIESIDLNEILSKLRTQYTNVANKNITIDFTPNPNCRVKANGLIVDVFSNLIGNAIKHSPGNRSVVISLRLTCLKEEGRTYYQVTVEDNGPGIPDAVKKKIFTRFQRGNTKALGKGLGLYLVRALVEDFHGSVWVDDRVVGDHTRGSKFIVTLPADEK